MQSCPHVPQLCTSVMRSGCGPFTPSQFESSPHLSTGLVGPTAPTHWTVPPTHASAPALQGGVLPGGGAGALWQGPTAWAGGCPLCLSGARSQSSWSPLHVSTPGWTLPWHWGEPFTHAVVPSRHGKLLLVPQ